MGLLALLIFCGLTIAFPYELDNSHTGVQRVGRSVKEEEALQLQLSNSTSLTSSSADRLYTPQCFIQRPGNPGGFPIKPDMQPRQCNRLVDWLVREHDHDDDLWLRRGQRFRAGRGSCFIMVQGAVHQSDNPYTGATYSDLARLIIRVVSYCTREPDNIGRYNKGGTIKIGEVDEEFLGFWLSVQGQPFDNRRPTGLLSSASNQSSIVDSTIS